MPAVRSSHLSFSYTSAVPIITDATFDLGSGWTGLVGSNGAGKSTLLSLVEGRRVPDGGIVVIDPPGSSPVVCGQRVGTITDEIGAFALDWSGEAVRMRATLSLEPSDAQRWESLSPGQRKRWQVGTALVGNPDVLLLDEPTNHLDTGARDLLVAALKEFKGCGIIVSHDRALLNELTTRTLRIIGSSVTLWSGRYDDARDGWLADAERLLPGGPGASRGGGGAPSDQNASWALIPTPSPYWAGRIFRRVSRSCLSGRRRSWRSSGTSTPKALPRPAPITVSRHRRPSATCVNIVAAARP